MLDHLELFRRSFDAVMGKSGRQRSFIDRFYRIFMAKSPEVASRFRDTDMDHQKIMLHDSLHYMVKYMHSEKSRRHIQAVARVHSRAAHDIPDYMYDIWLDSLVETVAECDPEFSPDVEIAWRIVMAPGITYMKSQYERP